MTTEQIKIENRVEYDTVYSNLVYPLDKGYYYNAELDAEWVEDRLQALFGASSIANKYAIEITGNSGHPMLIVNHDGKYYLIQKGKN